MPPTRVSRQRSKFAQVRIQSNKFLYFLLDKWRGNVATISFDGSRVSTSRPRLRKFQLSDIRASPKIVRRQFGHELSIEIEGSAKQLRIRSGDRGALQKFASEVDQLWREFNIDQWRSRSKTVVRVAAAVKKLNSPARYPAACLVRPFLESAQALEDQLFRKLNKTCIGAEAYEDIKAIRGFLSEPRKRRAEAVSEFERKQLEAWSEFFDSFDKHPLTPEQRRSVIADEDATLVLAGAGSGKTSTITAKACYLVKSGIRKPEEILLLAYARDAAKEMSERIAEKCGESFEARTFHALSYDIVGQVEGRKPALAKHATDDKALLSLIRNLLLELAETDSKVAKAMIDWFSSGHIDDKSEWDFKQKHDYYAHLEGLDLRTLQGDVVKSYEELLIANWLYANGVEYEYEPDYEHDARDPTKRDYCPDFRLTDSGVYLEHFGVRKKRGPGGEEILAPAPWVDREEYLQGMEWKRQVHEQHETVLIETYSYERQEGRLLEALAEKIEPHATLQPRPAETLFDQVVDLYKIDSFAQLLATFLRNFKSGSFAIEECRKKAESLNLGRRAKAFLAVFEPLYSAYQESLGKRIDFEDMVSRAAQYAESGRYRSPFGHILVDEFQDISRGRARLVKALLAQREDARLFAVGDDWQSIYRFAGSDIHLMRNFGEEFGGTFDGEAGVHSSVDLGRTFRSVDKIAFAARRFVLRNPAQLSKKVIPAATTEEPAIHVVSAFRQNSDLRLAEVLAQLEAKEAGSERRTSVLLLGRYRRSGPKNLSRLRASHPKLDISFKTIHASKGLEADHVILLQVFAGRMGFPSEIADDPLLMMVSPEAEQFRHAEERRVMYVAMTRARESLTIISSTEQISEFVGELTKDLEYGLTADDPTFAKAQVCGECQGQLFPVPTRNSGIFYRCEHAKFCGNWLPPCANCGSGLPVRTKNNDGATCDCGRTYHACPACPDGWLVERKGPYGKFLACVKFPRCTGKAKIERKKHPPARRRAEQTRAMAKRR